MSGVAAAPSGWRVLAQSAVAVVAPADTNENTLASITVPANAMGPNGRLRTTTHTTCTNNANAKTLRERFSGAAGTVFMAASIASVVTYRDMREISNRGAANSQIGVATGTSSANSTGTGGASVTAAVDTTVDTTVLITIQKATGADVVTLESYMVEVAYGA